MDAAARAARAEPAIFALIVDAKDDLAVTFYQRYEFRRFASKPASLFLPIATALQALSTTQPVKARPENSVREAEEEPWTANQQPARHRQGAQRDRGIDEREAQHA